MCHIDLKKWQHLHHSSLLPEGEFLVTRFGVQRKLGASRSKLGLWLKSYFEYDMSCV